jgi:hypothetical protein
MVKPWTPNLLQFHLNKLFVLTMVSNLALFCLATVLATFQKIGQFFPNHLVTLAECHNVVIVLILSRAKHLI